MKKKNIIFGLLIIFIAVSSIAVGEPSNYNGESAFLESKSKPRIARGFQENKSEKKKEVIVYITRTGKKYHAEDCRYIKKSKIRTTLQEACNRGYTPYKVCKPPKCSIN